MTELKDVWLFKELDAKELSILGAASLRRSYKTDEVLFFEGEEPKFLHLLTKGDAKLYKTSPSGNERFIHSARAVGLLGELANFENIPFPASAKFTTDGEAIKIDFSVFREVCLASPRGAEAIIRSLLEKLKILDSLIGREFGQNAQSKVAKSILLETHAWESLQKREIASRLNITPETLSRTLAKLKDDGVISIKGRTIKIIDDAKLQTAANNDF